MKFIDPWGKEFATREEAENALKQEILSDDIGGIFDMIEEEGNYFHINYKDLLEWIFNDGLWDRFYKAFAVNINAMIDTHVKKILDFDGEWVED